MEILKKRNVQTYLINDKGTWAVIARVYDPRDGRVHKRSKSTRIKVSKDERYKAEEIMQELQAEWEAQANQVVIRSKTKYICPCCGSSCLTSTPVDIICGDCDIQMLPAVYEFDNGNTNFGELPEEMAFEDFMTHIS